MKLKFIFFRDRSAYRRLRAKLYINNKLVATKPVERVIDEAPINERHRYNIAKVFSIHSKIWDRIPLEKRLLLHTAEEGETVELEIPE